MAWAMMSALGFHSSFSATSIMKKTETSNAKHQAHTMDGIIIGRSATSNALLVYNPRNKQYYEPNSYRIDSYRLPGSIYCNLKYNGGLFCYLYRDESPPIEDLYPPGTRVERINPFSKMLLADTVMDIPLISAISSSDDSSDPSYSYTILFDNGTSASIPLHEMASIIIIPNPPVDIDSSDSQDSLLPPFLRFNSKITYEHDGHFITKAFWTRGRVFTGLSSNLTPTNAKKNGGLIFLTYPPHGSISVLRAFLFRVMSLTLSFNP
jgi:hypothetical protein